METSTAPAIPLLTGERGGKPSLWCGICDQAWPLNDAQVALDQGCDHLEGVHGLTGPLYG